MSAIATRGPVWSKKDTYRASAANQGRGRAVVQGAADDQAAVAGTANVICLGIQEEANLNAGDPIAVIEMGDAIAVAGAAVAAGNLLKTDNAGRLVPVTGTAGDGENIVARAKTSCSNANDEILVIVLPSVL